MQTHKYLTLLWETILVIALLSACGRVAEIGAGPTPTPSVLTQWAVEAQASSEYGMPDWSAARATGEPDVNACADDPRAWASARGDGIAWLELTFEEPVRATEVRIYQTHGRGAISRVYLIDAEGVQQPLPVWEGRDSTAPCPSVLSVSFPRTDYLVGGVHIDLDESRTGFWNQIDAVALVGLR